MHSGFRVDTDNWVTEHEEARTLAQEVLALIQDRNVNTPTGPEASRKTAAARRKIGTLGTTIERLSKWLDGPDGVKLSEAERNRRRDLLHDLRNRREQMQVLLKRTQGQTDREALLESSGASNSRGAGGGGPRETEQTAELDTQGLLMLQQQTMDSQDQVLEQMEKSVKTTKHIALAIGEEVTLQTRLLDDLEDDVEVQQSRLKAATVKVKHLLKDKSHWKGGACIFLCIVAMVLIVLLSSKLMHLFGKG